MRLIIFLASQILGVFLLIVSFVPTTLADQTNLEKIPANEVIACESLNSASWLLGEWVADQGDTIVIERWHKVSPSTFEGSGEWRSKSNNELQSSESLRLLQMSGGVFYLANVSHNERPVAFKLKQCSPSHAVFENQEHDFPKIIEYQLTAKNRITATVTDGREKGFKLHFELRYDESVQDGEQ